MTTWHSLFDRRGFQAALCKRFDKPKSTVNAWRKNGIPPPYCLGVEEECNGEFTRKDFRPNDWQRYWKSVPDAKRAADVAA